MGAVVYLCIIAEGVACAGYFYRLTAAAGGAVRKRYGHAYRLFLLCRFFCLNGKLEKTTIQVNIILKSDSALFLCYIKIIKRCTAF